MPSGSASKRARAQQPEEEPAAPVGPPDDGNFHYKSKEHGEIVLRAASRTIRSFAMMEAAVDKDYQTLSVLMLRSAVVTPADLDRLRKLDGVETSEIYSQWAAASRVSPGNSPAS